jgi:glycosyltransferase involved in cell wall biosynthesis
MKLGERKNPVSLMRLFDVGVLTSKSEGLSNALIEYGAVGVPCVATDVGGNSEILENGVNGFLVPASSPEAVADRVFKLLKNRELRNRFGINARNLVLNRFDGERCISAYDDYYKKILSSR